MTERPGETDRLEGAALRRWTPCGDGEMVWRIWGDGPPLVLLHGGFGSWTHWQRNIAALARDFTVIAPDLPGLGDSDVPPTCRGAGDAGEIANILLEGLARILPEIQPQGTLRARRFHLGCFSFGAVPGSLVAVAAGDRLAGFTLASFTLVGAAGFGPRERPVEGLVPLRPGMDMAARRATARKNLEVLMFADPAEIDREAVDIHLANLSRARFRSRALSLSDTVLRALPRIRARCNAIWGAADITAAGMLEGRNTAIRASCPAAEIAVLDRIGHWVQYEAAEAFNECYRGMLHRVR